MTACDQKGLSLSPDFEILHDILHGSQFSIQPASLGGDAVQLPPEVGDVGFEEGLQALPHSPGTLLLQEAPFGLQDLVLLLQEPHLPPPEVRTHEHVFTAIASQRALGYRKPTVRGEPCKISGSRWQAPPPGSQAGRSLGCK